MSNTANTLNNNSLSGLVREAAPRVLAAIKKASAATGVDFAYMLEKASAESGFDTKAKSSSSSATGLYQFIDKTWLSMVKKYGAAVGLGKYAAAIDSNGHVANAAVKQQILALRKDPEKSAMLAAEYTADNKSYMQGQLPSTKIGSTELGLAHFLGAGSATAFLKAYQDNPLEQASDLFPKAANANRNVFYDAKTGQARTLAGVYDLFAKKFGGATTDTPSLVASAAGNDAASSTSVPAATAAAAPAAVDSRRALAQTLLSQVNDAQAALKAGTTDSSDDSLVTTVAAAGQQPAETIHWFSARQFQPQATTTVVAATTTSIPSTTSTLPTSLVSDPAQLMMMASRDNRHSFKSDTDRSFDHLNS